MTATVNELKSGKGLQNGRIGTRLITIVFYPHMEFFFFVQ